MKTSIGKIYWNIISRQSAVILKVFPRWLHTAVAKNPQNIIEQKRSNKAKCWKSGHTEKGWDWRQEWAPVGPRLAAWSMEVTRCGSHNGLQYYSSNWPGKVKAQIHNWPTFRHLSLCITYWERLVSMVWNVKLGIGMIVTIIVLLANEAVKDEHQQTRSLQLVHNSD